MYISDKIKDVLLQPPLQFSDKFGDFKKVS